MYYLYASKSFETDVSLDYIQMVVLAFDNGLYLAEGLYKVDKVTCQ